MQDLNNELEDENYRADLLKGMENYFDFIEIYYPHLRSSHNRLIPFVEYYKAKCGKNIGLVGLNSAWMCRRSRSQKGEIAIGEYQLNLAVKEMALKSYIDFPIFIFHHPISWLMPMDQRSCIKYFNKSILLSDHEIDSEIGYFDDMNNKFFQLTIGGACRGSSFHLQSMFQYIIFDFDNKFIKVDTRKLDKNTKIWRFNNDLSDDKSFSFPNLNILRKTFLIGKNNSK